MDPPFEPIIREIQAVLSIQKPLTLVAIVATISMGGCASTELLPPESSIPPMEMQTSQSQSGTNDDDVVPVAFNEDTLAPLVTEPIDAIETPFAFAKLISEADFGIDSASDPRHSAESDDSASDLPSLEAMAQTRHPELQRAEALVAQARGKACQAGLPYNTVFQYQSDEIGVDGASGLHSFGLSQRFVTANKLGIAQQEQLQIVQRRLAEYEFARLRVLTRVRAAFAEMVVAQSRASITQSISDLAARSADTVKSLLDAEEVSRIAFLQTRVEAQRADLIARNAITTLDQKRRALAATVGIEALPSETVCCELSEQLEPQPWQSLVDEISSLSPQITSAGAQLQRARWALQLACAQVTPDVTGQAGVGYDAASDDTFAVIGVSVPLPIRNRNQGNIRAARAAVAAASANIDQTQLTLQKALADAVGRYEVARQTYMQLREEISPNAEEAFDLARKAFESGEADYLQVLTAQRTLFDARLAAINALQTAKTADAEIQGALTNLVP